MSIFNGFNEQGKILNIFYQLGLVFLMFIAGFNTQISFEKQNIKIISTLFLGGTFLSASVGYFFIDYFKESFIGIKGNDLSFDLVFLIAIAITSIPVISKIFFDIGIIKTRFASIVLTTSTIQDLFLWILLNITINAATNQDLTLMSNLKTAFLTLFLFIGVKIISNLFAKISFRMNTIVFYFKFCCIIFINSIFKYDSY